MQTAQLKVVARILVSSLVMAVSNAGWSELQNVEIGGKIEVYGAWYSDVYEPNDGAVRIPESLLPYRPIGPNGTVSAIRAGGDGNTLSFFEQRTRLHVKADFTNEVTAFIEMDSIDTWGEDFRSNYITGGDVRGDTSDDVELYQSYIDVHELMNHPISLRIGRQELEFGSGWLVGADPGPDPFVGLSFDAVRVTYAADNFTLDAWWAKLAERANAEQDGDADFYGVYASFVESGEAAAQEPLHVHEAMIPTHLFYHGFRRIGLFHERALSTEEVQFDLYYMLLRDAARLNNTDFPWILEAVEDVFRLDNYDPTEFHTAGTRAAGQWNAVDWEIEAAYQWGEADAVGHLFVPIETFYGATGAEYDNWAGHAEAGYTFEVKSRPRVFAGGAYYGGDDNRNISFWDWVNPFSRPSASVSFNRLFSSWREDAFIDASAMSNFWKAYVGATAALPTDAFELGANVTYLEALEGFDNPACVSLAGLRIPLAPELSFWTEPGEENLGWQTSLWLTYSYCEDMTVEVGWSHWFVGGGIGDGVLFVDEYGTTNVGGTGTEDADYVYCLTTLEF